jgi:hypothetical protein
MPPLENISATESVRVTLSLSPCVKASFDVPRAVRPARVLLRASGAAASHNRLACEVQHDTDIHTRGSGKHCLSLSDNEGTCLGALASATLEAERQR